MLFIFFIIFFFFFSFFFFFCFFFFQAEDGIRDRTVTGVQTCALPISRTGGPARGARHARRTNCGDLRRHCGDCQDRPVERPAPYEQRAPVSAEVRARLYGGRSEERRVGKECRSRRWTYT